MLLRYKRGFRIPRQITNSHFHFLITVKCPKTVQTQVCSGNVLQSDGMWAL